MATPLQITGLDASGTCTTLQYDSAVRIGNRLCLLIQLGQQLETLYSDPMACQWQKCQQINEMKDSGGVEPDTVPDTVNNWLCGRGFARPGHASSALNWASGWFRSNDSVLFYYISLVDSRSDALYNSKSTDSSNLIQWSFHTSNLWNTHCFCSSLSL
jgi:hypothetical protein